MLQKIKDYYAWANRYRGDGHKTRGYLLLGLPFAVLVGVAYLTAAIAIQSVPLGIAGLYLVLANYLGILIAFKWIHNSDDWRDGGKMRKQWRRKGRISFALVGYPFGGDMGLIGSKYAAFVRSDDKPQAERLEGAEWGVHQVKAIALNIAQLVVLAMIVGVVL